MAAAHESRLHDDGAIDSGKETHYHHDAQHGGDEGHLPATSKNVRKVGNLDLFAGAEERGRIADVSAKGNYAYLTAFWEPECDRGGVYVVDISNPAKPEKVSLIPSHRGTFSGEGSQVISLDTPYFKGDLLVYQNEICPGETKGVGGVTLVDVTNPRQPKKLVEGFGDTTVNGKSQTHSNETHSAFAWQDGSKAYAVLVDDEEATDVDILEIMNPSRPTLISERNLSKETEQPLGAVHGDAVFLHDMVVKKIGGTQTMLLSYWDGGYVKLDVNDPADPKFIADTDFASLDPVRLDYGQSISPEGNAHQAEFTRDNKYFIATDEDFDPYRVTATMGDGTSFTAIQGSDVPQIDQDTTLCRRHPRCRTGVRYGVDSAGRRGPSGGGYRARSLRLHRQGAERRGAGLQGRHRVQPHGGGRLRDADQHAGRGEHPRRLRLAHGRLPHPPGRRAGRLHVLGGRRIGDGGAAGGRRRPDSRHQGRLRRLGLRPPVRRHDDAGRGPVRPARGSGPGIRRRLRRPVGARGGDRPRSQPRVHLLLRGRLPGRELRPRRHKEVGRFIDEGGNNFWGVEVHEHPNGQKYVLASDRDSGVYLFQYTG